MENVPLLAILLIGGSFFCVIAFCILGPLYLKIMLLLWTIIIICLRIFEKKLPSRGFFESYMYDIYATALFGIAFSSANYDEFGGGAWGAIGTFMLPFLAVFVFEWIGEKIRSIIDNKKKEKIDKIINHIQSEIKINKQHISNLEEKLNNMQNIIHFLYLIKDLGECVEEFENNPEIKKLNQISYEIGERRKKITEFEKEICEMENKLSSQE